MKTKNSAVSVSVDGVRLELDHKPTLHEAQAWVYGFIEFVKAKSSDTGQKVILVVNEEGKPRNLPVNHAISVEYGPSIHGGYIVGNVIILTGWQTLGSD